MRRFVCRLDGRYARRRACVRQFHAGRAFRKRSVAEACCLPGGIRHGWRNMWIRIAAGGRAVQQSCGGNGIFDDGGVGTGCCGSVRIVYGNAVAVVDLPRLVWWLHHDGSIVQATFIQAQWRMVAMTGIENGKVKFSAWLYGALTLAEVVWYNVRINGGEINMLAENGICEKKDKVVRRTMCWHRHH